MSTRNIKPILVMPIGTDQKTVDFARKAGYVPILIDDPTKVKVILPHDSVASTNDLLMSCMHGLAAAYEGPRAKAFDELHRRLKLKEQKPSPPPHE